LFLKNPALGVVGGLFSQCKPCREAINNSKAAGKKKARSQAKAKLLLDSDDSEGNIE
jgi:hypothetical protein